MLKNGYYQVAFRTNRGEGSARVKLEDGLLSGETDRGTRLDGLCGTDAERHFVRFEIAATVPANTASLAGLTTTDEPRKLMLRGETRLCDPTARFSLDINGRAVEVEARYLTPL